MGRTKKLKPTRLRKTGCFQQAIPLQLKCRPVSTAKPIKNAFEIFLSDKRDINPSPAKT